MADRIHALTMPKLGLSMTEGAVVAWHVELGAEITSGELVADIETSKITNELDVHVSGVLRKTLVDLGEEVDVGTLIAVIADADVSDDEIDQFIAGFTPDDTNDGEAQEPVSADTAATPSAPTTQPEDGGADSHIPESLAGDYDVDAVFASHHAHKLAQSQNIDLTKITGTGRRGRISKNDVTAAVSAAGGEAKLTKTASAGQKRSGKIKTTPIAERLAAQHGIDLAEVEPTGTRGRVTKGDVLRHIESASASKSTPAALPQDVDSANPYEEESLSSTRKVIAARLSESKNLAPHFRVSVDVVIDKVLELRRDIEQEETGVKVSINDMLIRAAALALAKHPKVNIQFDGQTVRKYTNADVAVAVALDDGLVTPIVRGANEKGLIEIAREIGDLVERARSGKLLPDEFQGGTFTISNLGMFGVKSFDAIINPPQAAIMAIGRAEKRLYVGEEDSGRVATFMTVTMSCDHRVIDGATGGKFLQTFKDMLQHPGRLLL